MKRMNQPSSELRAQAEQIDRELNAIRKTLRKPLDVEESKGQLTIPQKAVMQTVVRNHGISLKDLWEGVMCSLNGERNHRSIDEARHE